MKIKKKRLRKLYDKLPNIDITQYGNLSEDLKKKIGVLNRRENLVRDFLEDDLPPMLALEGDKEVKLEREENISGRRKLYTPKKILLIENFNYKQIIN